MQTRKQTVIEVLTGTVTGFIGSFLITLVVFSIFKELGTAALVNTAACTVWSLVRGYCVRRWFNGLQPRKRGPVQVELSVDTRAVSAVIDKMVDDICRGQIIRSTWEMPLKEFSELTDEEWRMVYYGEWPMRADVAPKVLHAFEARR